MSPQVQYPHLAFDDQGIVRIVNTRFKVIHLAGEHYHYGWTAEDLLENHPDLRPEEVYASLTYFYDHYDEMVAQMRASSEAAELARAHSQQPTRAELMRRKALMDKKQ